VTKKTKDRLIDVDNALKDLRDSISRLDVADMSEFERKVDDFRQEIYDGITRWGSVELSRYPDRPGIDGYIERIFESFMELKGDRTYEDDPAIIGGLAFLDDTPVVIIGHKKHSTHTKDYMKYHYGMASPSGHHKAMRLLRLAEKFSRPLITFVDTPGAYPVPEAEYRGQAFSIAQCIAAIASVRAPVVACIIGEAGSGGALALGFGDRIIMLENAFYGSISPEGFSSIMFGDSSMKVSAADTLKGTGKDLYREGIVDSLVKEPVGGAHNNPELVIDEVGRLIRHHVHELQSLAVDELIMQRTRSIQSLVPRG